MNCELLLEKFDGNRGQVLKCLELFTIELPALLQAVESGICRENIMELKNACHDFRGMVLTMEMHHAASIILQMEGLADREQFKKAGDVYRLLKDEISYTIDYLKSTLNFNK